MNIRHPMGGLNSFSIKNIFHDIMGLRLFYFHVTTLRITQVIKISGDNSLSLINSYHATGLFLYSLKMFSADMERNRLHETG